MANKPRHPRFVRAHRLFEEHEKQRADDNEAARAYLDAYERELTISVLRNHNVPSARAHEIVYNFPRNRYEWGEQRLIDYLQSFGFSEGEAEDMVERVLALEG
jgi:hypothetical protein